MAQVLNNPVVIVGGGGGGGDNLWNEFVVNKRTDWSYMFANFSGNSIDLYLAGQDSSKVTNASYMFSQCNALKSVPNFNTSNVTNMENMFFYCNSLKTAPAMDTSKVTKMGAMFRYARSLESVPAYNTSKVTTVSYMFGSCEALKSVPFLDLSSATDVSSMFEGCQSLETIELASWEKVTSTYSAGNIASKCYKLKNFIIRNATKAPLLAGSATSYNAPFKDCYRLLGTYNVTYNPRAKSGNIYVPDDLVDTFKTATYWSDYANLIRPISEYLETPELLADLISMGNPAGSSANITQASNDYQYETSSGSAVYRITFNVPEGATNRKMKITFLNKSNTSKYLFACSEIDDSSVILPGNATANNMYFYYNSVDNGIAQEVVYENLPIGKHLIHIPWNSGVGLYFSIDFIE